MNPPAISKIMIVITVAWMVLAAALAGLAFAGLVGKSFFQWGFVGGFVLYAVVITLLTRWRDDSIKKP